jgi:hypothetical protein
VKRPDLIADHGIPPHLATAFPSLNSSYLRNNWDDHPLHKRMHTVAKSIRGSREFITLDLQKIMQLVK